MQRVLPSLFQNEACGATRSWNWDVGRWGEAARPNILGTEIFPLGQPLPFLRSGAVQRVRKLVSSHGIDVTAWREGTSLITVHPLSNLRSKWWFCGGPDHCSLRQSYIKIKGGLWCLKARRSLWSVPSTRPHFLVCGRQIIIIKNGIELLIIYNYPRNDWWNDWYWNILYSIVKYYCMKWHIVKIHTKQHTIDIYRL